MDMGLPWGKQKRRLSAFGIPRNGRATAFLRRQTRERRETYTWMAAHTRGVIKDLELGTFIPRAKARPNPAPANSRLETQLKKVMICLRQCCSPSVRVILAFSARSRMMKRPMLATRPIIPCGCSWLGQHARLVASWVSANLAGEEGRTHHCKAARG